MKLTDLQRLCGQVRLLFDDAVIAGGAPRDIIGGVEVKDIDVFTSIGVDDSDIERLAKLVGGMTVPLEPGDESLYDASLEHLITFDFPDPPLNIIDLSVLGVTNALEYVHEFDFGVSQVAVTPNGVFYTPQFIQDFRSGTLTYLPNGPREKWMIDSSIRRLQRLKSKYPMLTPVNCEGLEEHE